MERIKLLRELVKAAQEGDKEKAKAILWEIDCADFLEWLKHLKEDTTPSSATSKTLAGRGEDNGRLSEVFYFYLRKTSCTDDV